MSRSFLWGWRSYAENSVWVPRSLRQLRKSSGENVGARPDTMMITASLRCNWALRHERLPRLKAVGVPPPLKQG